MSCAARTPAPSTSTSRPTASASSSPLTPRPSNAPMAGLRWPKWKSSPARRQSLRATGNGTSARRSTAPTALASPSLPAMSAASTRCRRCWRCGPGTGAVQAAAGKPSANSGTTRCTRRCTGKTTAKPCSFVPSKKAARTCGALTLPTAAPKWWWPAAGSAASTRQRARSSRWPTRRCTPAASTPTRPVHTVARAVSRCASKVSTTHCWPRGPWAASKKSGSRAPTRRQKNAARAATTCKCGLSIRQVSTPRSSTRSCTTSTAARTPALGTTGITAGTRNCLRPRATWWPASTSTALQASAMPSWTASRTAGVGWKCRMWKPAPTGC